MKSGYNIKEIRQLFNLTQQELATALGITRELVNKMEKGRSPVSKATAALLNRFTSERQSEFSSHDGQELALLGMASNRSGQPYHFQRREKKNVPSRLMVPMVGIKAQAGYLRGFEQADYIETLDHFPILPGVNPTGAVWSYFEVDGESMEPNLYAGDLILASMLPHEDWQDLRDNSVYILLTPDQLLVKRVVKKNEKEWVLNSDNHALFPPLTISVDDIRQVWTFRRHIRSRLPAA